MYLNMSFCTGDNFTNFHFLCDFICYVFVPNMHISIFYTFVRHSRYLVLNILADLLWISHTAFSTVGSGWSNYNIKPTTFNVFEKLYYLVSWRYWRCFLPIKKLKWFLVKRKGWWLACLQYGGIWVQLMFCEPSIAGSNIVVLGGNLIFPCNTSRANFHVSVLTIRRIWALMRILASGIGTTFQYYLWFFGQRGFRLCWLDIAWHNTVISWWQHATTAHIFFAVLHAINCLFWCDGREYCWHPIPYINSDIWTLSLYEVVTDWLLYVNCCNIICIWHSGCVGVGCEKFCSDVMT